MQFPEATITAKYRPLLPHQTDANLVLIVRFLSRTTKNIVRNTDNVLGVIYWNVTVVKTLQMFAGGHYSPKDGKDRDKLGTLYIDE